MSQRESSHEQPAIGFVSEETKKQRFVELLREKINKDDILKEINIETKLLTVDNMTLADLYVIDDNTLAYVKKQKIIFFPLHFVFCYLFYGNSHFAHYVFKKHNNKQKKGRLQQQWD